MKKKILIFANYFCAWDGGIDLIKHWLSCINFSNQKKKLEITIVLPKNNLLSFLKLIFFPFIFFLKNLSNNRMLYKSWPYWKGALEIEKHIFDKLSYKIKIIYSDYANKKKILENYKGVALFPSINEVLSKKNSIGYIFDLQHEYLKKNFSREEVKIRRKRIKNLSCLNKILVNSNKTKKDLLFFYSEFKKDQISVIPFAPTNINLNKQEKFGSYKELKFKNYFIVCNKFWKHKNHIVVLKAFNIYKKSGGKNNLLFTGEYKDPRSEKVINEIKKYIYQNKLSNFVEISGRIKKNIQLNLLNKSEALIQPTLFEGGPGGGSVYDAISLDVPVILSNIEVNREIKYNKTLFFNPYDYKELYKNLVYIEKKLFKNQHKKYFKKKSLLIKKCGNFLVNKFINI